MVLGNRARGNQIGTDSDEHIVAIANSALRAGARRRGIVAVADAA